MEWVDETELNEPPTYRLSGIGKTRQNIANRIGKNKTWQKTWQTWKPWKSHRSNALQLSAFLAFSFSFSFEPLLLIHHQEKKSEKKHGSILHNAFVTCVSLQSPLSPSRQKEILRNKEEEGQLTSWVRVVETDLFGPRRWWRMMMNMMNARTHWKRKQTKPKLLSFRKTRWMHGCNARKRRSWWVIISAYLLMRLLHRLWTKFWIAGVQSQVGTSSWSERRRWTVGM